MTAPIGRFVLLVCPLGFFQGQLHEVLVHSCLLFHHDFQRPGEDVRLDACAALADGVDLHRAAAKLGRRDFDLPGVALDAAQEHRAAA